MGNSSAAIALYTHQWAYQSAVDGFVPGTALNIITSVASGKKEEILTVSPTGIITISLKLPVAGKDLVDSANAAAFDDSMGIVKAYSIWQQQNRNSINSQPGTSYCSSKDYLKRYYLTIVPADQPGIFVMTHNFPNISSPLTSGQSGLDSSWIPTMREYCGSADFVDYVTQKKIEDEKLKALFHDYIAWRFSRGPTMLEGWDIKNFPYAQGTMCTPETCPGAGVTVGGGGSDGSSGGGSSTTAPGSSGPITVNVPAPNVTVNTPPPCTLSDGKTSNNPYDCAPKDADAGCSIIDLPCNLKRAFIPSPDFFQDSFREYVNKRLNLPIEGTNNFRVETGLQIAPVLEIDFSFMRSDVVQNVLKLIAWFQVAFWILNYIGFPNPFGGSRRGDSFAATALNEVLPPDSVGVDTGSKEHYDRLRADESWKQ